MPNFSYIVLDKAGREKKGKVIKQPDWASAYGELSKIYTDIIELTQIKTIPFLDKCNERFSSISQKEILIFYNQITFLLQSGQELSKSLETIERQILNPKFSKIIGDIRLRHKAGDPLYVAFISYTDIFGQIAIELIKLGESTGSIDESFYRLHTMLEKRIKLKGEIIQEVITPVMGIFSIITLFVSLVIFIVPKITEMFDSMDLDLPLTTKALIGFSDFTISYWWFIGLLIIGTSYAYNKYKKTPKGKHKIEKIYLKIPLVKKINQLYNVTQWCSNFAILVGAGVSTINSLYKLGSIMDNIVYKEATLASAKAFEAGEKLHVTLNYDDLFPPMLISLIATGEETGKLKECLNNVAKYQEEEFARQLKVYVSLINPIIMIGLSIALIVIMLAIFTPFSQIINNAGRGL